MNVYDSYALATMIIYDSLVYPSRLLNRVSVSVTVPASVTVPLHYCYLWWSIIIFNHRYLIFYIKFNS